MNLKMKKIRDLLDSFGLMKVRDYSYDSYFVLSNKVQLYGEIIRLMKESNGDDKVVFFAQLVDRRSTLTKDNILNMPYTHLFTYGLETIPDKFEHFKHENHFIVEGTQEELDFIKWVVQNSIKQKKELERKIALDKIDEDF